ncbi:MAG: hypothetical protein H6719_33425 [Sandaracinaceae bacterium]|nr:hypothetical protein [Sandaracinaceae bacterium]
MPTVRQIALFALVLGGCPETTASPSRTEPAVCEHMGDRCQLPEGPIGVCSETTAPCDEPPCLACMSQH